MSYSSEELLLDSQLKMILLFLILVLGVTPQFILNLKQTVVAPPPFRQFCCDWLLSLTKVKDQNVGGAYVPKMTCHVYLLSLRDLVQSKELKRLPEA